jgi:hypothetical protein
MNQSKKLVIISLIWAFLMAMILLSSCGVTKKNTQTFTEKVDSTFTQIKKEDNQVNNDTTHVISLDNKTEEVKTDSSSLIVNFSDNTDSTAYTSIPVTIKTDTSGVITINPGGRKIKSITNTTKRIKATNEAIKANDSTHVVSASNTHKIDSTKSDFTKNVNTNIVKKFSFQVPWYAYIILIIAGFLLWFFWGQIITAKKIVSAIKIPKL